MKELIYILCLLCFHICFSYKPVIMLHGINDNEGEFTLMQEIIQQYHPGTKTYPIPRFDNWKSEISLDIQIKFLTEYVENMTTSDNAFSNGYHFVCHSQGRQTYVP
jgi:palmitoyl-protein thioesterase